MLSAGHIWFNPNQQQGTYVWNGHAWVWVAPVPPTTPPPTTHTHAYTLPSIYPPSAHSAESAEPAPPTEEEIAEAIESIKRALIAQRAS